MPRKPKNDHRTEYREDGRLVLALTMPNPVRFVIEDDTDQVHIERTALGGDFVTKHLTRANAKKPWRHAQASCADAIHRLNTAIERVGAPCGVIR